MVFFFCGLQQLLGSCLLAHLKILKRIGHHRASARTTSLRWRRRRRRTVFSGDQENVARLAVQCRRFGTQRRLHGLFHHKAGRIVFLNDRDRAIALRTERFLAAP